MKRCLPLLVVLLSISPIGGLAMAQDSWNIDMLGEVHPFIEQVFDVAMSGDYAYISSGTATGLRVLDLSDPSEPLEVGYSLNLDTCPGVATWMADRVLVSGDRAYVLYFDGTWAFAHYRLYVYNVSDPAEPWPMGYIDLPDNCTSLFLAGDSVYVTAFEMEGFSGVKVVDVSDPTQPVEAGAFTTPGMPHDVAVIDDIAYVADNDSLVIFDVTDLGSVVEVGRYAPEGEAALIHYVTVDGQYVYLIDSLFGVRILDVSNLDQIEEVASIPHNQADALLSHIRICNDRAYYLQHGDGEEKSLIILDVSDPRAASEMGRHDMLGFWWFHGFDVSAGYACVAGAQNGLRVLSVANPNEIEEVSHYQRPSRTMGLAVSGDHTFISTHADSNNLLIYDVSDPSSIQEVKALDLEGRPKWISSWGSHLYLPGVEIDLTLGVNVLDISNPAEPESIAFWVCPSGELGIPMSITRHENYAIVALAYGGVQILDVTDIDQPIALGSWTLWDMVTNIDFAVLNVEVSWPYLFLPDQAYGLYVLDASDPANLEQVASCPTPGQAWWVALSPDDHHLYLADNTGGLRVFDVSNPLLPAPVGLIQGNLQHVSHVLSSGDSIYVADGRGIGLRVYDVSDPTAPQEVAYHRTPGIYITDIVLANGLIYVADDTHFEIFEVDQGPSGAEETQPAQVVSDYRIHSVYPNPFNASTRIIFDLAEAGHVTLQVYNITGQKVQTLADGHYRAGHHTQLFRADHLASGIYILRLEVNGVRDMRKVVLVR
jgi:hypothetical protein